MTYRLNTKRLKENAGAKGDHSGYAIAKRTGLTEPAVSKLLRNKTQPAVKTLLLFRRAYGGIVDDYLIEEASEAAA